MRLEKEYLQLQELLYNSPKQVNVFFEAHYWGKFRFLANGPDLFPDPKGYLPLAQSQSPPHDVWLFLDQARQHILLRHGDEREEKKIATSLEEFWGTPEHWEKRIQADPTSLYFDERKTLDLLLAPTDYLITEIDDPEHFEEVDAYVGLLELCDSLMQGALAFDRVEGKEMADAKILTLEKGEQHWQLTITKELFDQAFIDQINTLLPELGFNDFTFATSIHENMRMILLKLNAEQFQLLNRMGMLI